MSLDFSVESHILLNFVNLCQVFCQRLQFIWLILTKQKLQQYLYKYNIPSVYFICLLRLFISNPCCKCCRKSKTIVDQPYFPTASKCMIIFDNRTRCYPTGTYMFKVNNRNARTKCKICSKLTIDTRTTPLASYIFNFEYISHLVLEFLQYFYWDKFSYAKIDLTSVMILPMEYLTL